jgi:heterotetrameric sarcosine oxidase delta subunit
MLLITCPHCGPRDHTEFQFGGDASLRRPDPAAAFEDGWYDFIYLRDNVRGMHRELWQHRSGCRMWLVVERDTLTHAIASVGFARDMQPAPTPQSVGS